MLIENQPVEKKTKTTLSVVRKKASRPVKVIKMAAAAFQPGDKENLHPPINPFNTGYLKARDHDPL
jgi:hypothetical protein